MLWSGGAGIGVSADGRFFRNHNFSRAINAHDIACLNSPESNWSNVIYQLCKPYIYNMSVDIVCCCVIDGDYIPFLELGRTADVNRVPLMSTLDSKSANISIPVPFAFGSTRLTSLAVSIVTKL